MASYGRILNSNETDQGERGTSGFLGARTEQFALGSLFYLINYGVEVYGDQCLTEDPYEHGPKVVDLLQNMEFPKLDHDPLIDHIIDKCWHNRYVIVSELAAHTKMLLDGGHGESSEEDKKLLKEELLSKREVCLDLEKRGLLHLLWPGEPEQLGFTFDWYRHNL